MWTPRSSRVVGGQATGDFLECASVARVLEGVFVFGAKEMRVRRLNFASPLMSHTLSRRHVYSVELEPFGCGDLMVFTRARAVAA